MERGDEGGEGGWTALGHGEGWRQGEGAKGVTMGREGGGTVPWTR